MPVTDTSQFSSTLCFRDNILSVPGFAFEKASPWNDTGSSTLIAEGRSLKDGALVLAKIAPAHSASSVCLQREAHILSKLGESSEALSTTLRLIEFLTVPRADGDCVVLLLVHPGANLLARYFPPSKVNDFLLAEAEGSRQAHHDQDVSLNEEVSSVSGATDDTQKTEEQHDDIYDSAFLPLDDLDLHDIEGVEEEKYDVMDLASFLEFAIQATHCLDVVHRLGFVHREVRANAFHINVHSGVVRIVHFGNRSVSLEEAGGPSQLVIDYSHPFHGRSASSLDLVASSSRFPSPALSTSQLPNHSDTILISRSISPEKVIEALHYLAPEQVSSSPSVVQEDHRADLYSLGMLFWTCVVGRGRLPFALSGTNHSNVSPAEVLAALGTKRPPPVDKVRSDVPTVIGDIIDKLLSKSPDSRYQSAYGLKADLLECQKRLLSTVSASTLEQFTEAGQIIIPTFQIGQEDKYSTFIIPHTLFGRDKELETIRNVIRHSLTSFSRQSSTAQALAPRSIASSSSQGTGTDNDEEEAMSSVASSEESPKLTAAKVEGACSYPAGRGAATPSPVNSVTKLGRDAKELIFPLPTGSSDVATNSLRKVALQAKERGIKTHTIIVAGAAGVGKSSLVMANQSKWKLNGLWAHAKFQTIDKAPFAALLSALSSALRQLTFKPADAYHFVRTLTERLGPQRANLPLLFAGSPVIKAVLEGWGMNTTALGNGIENAIEKASGEPGGWARLATGELSVRFQNLVESVFAVVTETRPVALFLDDLHEADNASLDVVDALINSRSRLLIFATVRSTDKQLLDRIRSMCSTRARATWITLEQLPFFAISSFVAKALHRSREDCLRLSRLVYTASGGNAFLARNLLSAMRRHHQITFDWARNHWQFDITAIESSLVNQKTTSDPVDQFFLIENFRELPEATRKYLMWASLFGTTFKANEVALLIDWEDSSGSSSEEEEETWNLSKAISMLKNRGSSIGDSMRGLQSAINEGWLVQRGRDMCSFAHDQYRLAVQQEVAALPANVLSRMSFRIVLAVLHDAVPDVHRIVDHAARCIPLLLKYPNREQLLDVLVDAGESAWARGAHELAFQAFLSAQCLLSADHWAVNPKRSSLLVSKLAELCTWKGDLKKSESLITEYIQHSQSPEDQARALRVRANNHFLRNEFSDALDTLVHALRILGVEMESSATHEVADAMFEDVKSQILAIGYEEMLKIPRATDVRTDLAVSILNDAGTNAYWTLSESMIDVIGLTTINLALRFGISPGTSLGFFWAIGAAAERRELFKFSVDLGKLALRIAYLHGGSMEKCRATLLYTALVAPYDNVHMRHTIPLLEDGLRHGHSSGDRGYTCFVSVYTVLARLYTCEHLSDLMVAAEECTNDVDAWTPNSDVTILAQGLLNCIRAMGGYTDASSVDTVFNTDTFDDKEYQKRITQITGNSLLSLGWYNAFKVVALYCTGFFDAAAELGFMVYDVRGCHPNHRHARYSAFFHSLALIACLRRGDLDSETRTRYIDQVTKNQAYIRRWLSSSPVNTGTWIALVEAEMASLNGDNGALRLYDMAVKLASNHEWLLEEGFALYLEGCHLIRTGVEGLGAELQQQGIAKEMQWGAYGIVRSLSAVVDPQFQPPLRRPVSYVNAAVQADAYINKSPLSVSPTLSLDGQGTDELDGISSLPPSDLMLIIRKSKEIADCLSLSSALQRLTEIAADMCQSHCSCIVITTQVGEYGVATILQPPQLCQVFENPKPLRMLESSQITAIQSVLDSKQSYHKEEHSNDETHQSLSEIGLPIFSNRGQILGALYVSTKRILSQTTVLTLNVLCQQANISISSAILFRSVQAGTRENLKMIASQKEALEAARKSREDAIRATRVKSRFIANMSHEMRTPFSSFYGLLDLLSGTELNAGQREIVDTAKQSCEILLKIIDSILDYSKLEASAMKLDFSAFPVENVIADCLELFLPVATKKLHLSYNIEEDVPEWIFSDHTRIRQVLMNLIGNAIKFTESGSVTVLCSMDKEPMHASSEQVFVKFSVKDTGIGLSPDARGMLFVPFQQVDNSSTRRFGGTGLGLSISRQLVKLLGGSIGVDSNVDVGSTFWFTIPVKICETEDLRKASSEVERLRSILTQPRPSKVVICSISSATRALLRSILKGFDVTLLSDLDAVRSHLEGYRRDDQLDFLILDDQFQTQVADVIQILRCPKIPALYHTKIVHLYTPTTQSLSESTAIGGNPNVAKIIKPARKLRILQVLAELKGVAFTTPPSPVVTMSPVVETPQRTLFGNVLIAEDNAVAQNLLVKQLERYQLKVVATNDGQEALNGCPAFWWPRHSLTSCTAWESREPGYFALALFDHHMPVCDGVEATRRLRKLESVRCPTISLPIVALSADAQESTKQCCLSAGMNLFLSKPLKKTDLMSLLEMFGPPRATTANIP
ncbi:STKc type histidine kinase [Pisolithus thermaeus]|nr:STKc type histidine kinase [Pisolithus thermaeus]